MQHMHATLPQTARHTPNSNPYSSLKQEWSAPYLDCIVVLSKPSLAGLLICGSEGLIGLHAMQHTLPAVLTVHVSYHEVITHHLTQLLV